MSAGHAYIGAAGTGKTTRLISDLEEIVKHIQWEKYNSVLALTFMHGSRRRLQEKLAFLKRTKIPYQCLTIDSFSTQIVQRFREYISISKPVSIRASEDDEVTEDAKAIYLNWNAVRKYFVKLLDLTVVREYLRVSYPVLIIDELQDCDDELLAVIKSLTECGMIILFAGDHFQQLSDQEDCPAIDWLSEKYKAAELTKIHRTSESTILDTAHGLRNNTFVTNSIEAKVVSTGSLLAWFISSRIQWYSWGSRGKTLAILYPVSPERSTFVKETLERLKLPFKKHSPPLGPYPMTIENDGVSMETSLLVKLFGDSDQPFVSKIWLKSHLDREDFLTNLCLKRALHLLNVRGLEEMLRQEFEGIVGRQCHLYRSYFNSSSRNMHLAMTIHAAKNREFDEVIIVWPYEAPTRDVYRRKLLYNAITRAKKRAILFIQGKDRSVIEKNKVLALFGRVEVVGETKPKKNSGTKHT